MSKYVIEFMGQGTKAGRKPWSRHGVNLEVQLQDCRSYSEKVLHAKGSDKHPMSRDETLKKFRLLV